MLARGLLSDDDLNRFPTTDSPAAVGGIVRDLMLGSPDAQRRIKLLLDEVSSGTLADACERTPAFIAEARASNDGQEGLRAFLEKRAPSWQEDA